MKFIDLFAGVGGFRLPLEQLEHKCVWSCDIDKYCEQVYKYHWGDGFEAKDIKEVDTRTIPDFDLLCAGFPCQSFSIAGKRKGFEDTRGTLFFEICKILKDKRPKMVLLENVKGLLSHDNYRTFRTILESLRELGYVGQYQVLNSKDFGVPQNRERVFIVGHLGGETRSEVFPIGENGSTSKGKDEPGSGSPQTTTTRPIRTKVDRGEDTFILQQVGNVDTKGHNSLWRRVYNPDGLSTNLNAEGGGLGAKTGLYAILTDNQGGNIKKRIKEADKNPSWCLGGSETKIMDNFRVRRLTPLECERLQGFPDGWTALGIDENGNMVKISDNQRYKMMGNAVTVNVVYEIGKKWENR